MSAEPSYPGPAGAVLRPARFAPPPAELELRSLATIAAAAADAEREAVEVDRLIVAWLAERRLLGFDPDVVASLPGWAGRLRWAADLVGALLPGWRVDFSGPAALLVPPLSAPQPHEDQLDANPDERSCAIRGDGPTPARALLAAAFDSLFAGLLASGAAHV